MRLDDNTGKGVLALTVFSMSIQFLKDDLLETVSKAVSGIKMSDIHWVITVPAIWDNDAKQFIREAAQKVKPVIKSVYHHAGMCSNRLRPTHYFNVVPDVDDVESTVRVRSL